jgi:hypothetical protein
VVVRCVELHCDSDNDRDSDSDNYTVTMMAVIPARHATCGCVEFFAALK